MFPTNDWLIPLSKLNTNDINTRNVIMVANHFEKNNVIVKITKNIAFDDIQNIDNSIKELPNFPEIYGIFECYETENNIDSLYENVKGFCNKSEDKTSNIKIVIEIMKQYKKSLRNYERKIKINDFENYLKQRTLAQSHAFNQTGFLHNDIQLGNILIDYYSKEPIEIIYTILNKKYAIFTNNRIIITDFDNSVIMNKNINFDDNNTLYSNIIKTFRDFSQLIDITEGLEGLKLLQILDEIIFDKKLYYNDREISSMNSMIYYGVQMDDYKKNVLRHNMKMINEIWMKMFGKIIFETIQINENEKK